MMPAFMTYNAYYCDLMRYKQILLGFLILAYALSLAHSVIPHHHFNSRQESASHHQQEESKHDHNDNHDQQQDGGLTFPAHFSNSDVSVSKFSFDQRVKVKAEWHIIKAEDVLLTGLYFLNPVFHVPIDSQRYDQLIFSSRSLRAPPSIS